MNYSSTTWRQYCLLTLLFTLIAMMLLSPLSSNVNIPNLWDIWNHLANIYYANLALTEGQFPLRVAPEALNSWRYPQFQFYSPTSYMFAAFIYRWWTPNNLFIAYKITILIALVFGGLYFYRLANWLVQSKWAAILSAVVYLTSPYYMIVIDHMGGFNEAIAMGILPAVIYYTLQRYYFPRNNKTLLQVSLSWYALATIHLITFFYTSLIMAILLLLMTIKNRRHWLNLINVGLAYLFGSMLAMWYVGPIYLFGQSLAITRTMAKDIFSPSLTNLFSPISNISGGVVYPEGFVNVISQIHPNLGLSILFGMLLSIYYIFKPNDKKRFTRSSYFVPYLVSLFLGSLLLAWSPIDIWHRVPRFLSMFQYSWRLLSQVVWIGALLFAWSITVLLKNELTHKVALLILMIMIISSSSWLPITERAFMNAEGFFKKPRLITNPDSYVIDGGKNINYIQTIDNMTLNAFINEPNNSLKLDSAFPVSKRLIHSSNPLSISLSGNFSTKTHSYPQLLAIADKTVMAKLKLKPGKFEWNIPLSLMRPLLKNKSSLDLKFTLNKKTTSSKIILEKMVMTGYLPSGKFLSANSIQKNCKQDGLYTICNLMVPSGVELLELPVLYYPDMLEIKLNGRGVPYLSVFYEKYLLAGISPQPNQMNEISIQFVGLLWANYISQVGWSMWGLFLTFIILRQFKTKLITNFSQADSELVSE